MSFSDRDDVTLPNPVEPPRRWHAEVGGRRPGGRRRTSRWAIRCTSRRCPSASRKSRGRRTPSDVTLLGVAHVSLADVADAYLYLGPIDSLTLAEPPGEP
jgi:hypothetical protein